MAASGISRLVAESRIFDERHATTGLYRRETARPIAVSASQNHTNSSFPKLVGRRFEQQVD